MLTDAQLLAMGHNPQLCNCDLCWPPNTDPATQPASMPARRIIESVSTERARLAAEQASEDHRYALELLADDDPGMPVWRVSELAEIAADLNAAHLRAAAH